MLLGKKVRLREIRKADIQNYLKWFNDQEVTQYLTLFLPMTQMSEEKWLEEICTSRAQTDVVFAIEVKAGKKWVHIGNCGLHKINWHDRDCEMGTVIGEKKFWGKGYGTEADRLLIDYGFGELNMNRISAAAYNFNTRSCKTAERNGFKREGIARKAIYKNGQYHDRIMMGILREEWEKKG